MGFRVASARELDPQIRGLGQQQISPGNPYFSQMMGQDETAHQRQLNLRQQEGTAIGQQRAAEIAKANAWTQGLDNLSKSFLPAAQATQGMRLASRQMDENERTGEVNRTSAMENALRTRQQRELDAAFAPQERQAGLGLTAAQTAAAQTTNEAAKIDLQSKQAKQLFEQADAAKYGFQNAKEGETVAQYTMRMDAEGKIADVQRVKAESAKMQQEMQYMPERLRLEKLQALAGIEASRASAASARTMASVAVAGSNREQQAHEINMLTQKTALMEKEIDDVMKGISSGSLYGRQLTAQESAQILQKKIQDLGARYGVNADTDAAVARAIAKNSSDAKAAQAADIATANLHPGRRALIEKDVSNQKLAIAGTELMRGLDEKIKKYSGAGRIWDSKEATLAGEEIQVALDSAAAAEPRFKPYADKFRQINAGVYAGGLQSVKNLFGDSPVDQAKNLLKSISNTIMTELNATNVSDPVTAGALHMAKQNFNQSTNVFNQSMMHQQLNVPTVPMAPQYIPANNQVPNTQRPAGYGGRR
jgi:hypothetical protein